MILSNHHLKSLRHYRHYTRTKQRKRDGVDVSFWWCENRRLSEKSCSQKGMRESAIEEAFVIAMHELAGDFGSVRKVLDLSIKNALSSRDGWTLRSNDCRS